MNSLCNHQARLLSVQRREELRQRLHLDKCLAPEKNAELEALSSVQLQSNFETKRRMWFSFLQRREELRQRLHLDKYLAPEMNAEPAARDAGGPRAAPASVDMFDCDGVTTTVTTIAMNSDDEQCVLLLTTMMVGRNAADTSDCNGLSVTTSAMHSDDEQQVPVSCFRLQFPL